MVYNILSFVFTLNVFRTLASDVSDKMAAAKIVPDVIPIAPNQFLKITYLSGAKVDLGNQLTPREVINEPLAQWIFNPNQLHTLCMFDADSHLPFNSSKGEWLHWLVVDIPEGEIGKGDILVEFVGIFPRWRTGVHRYVFLVYEQRNRINFNGTRSNTKPLIDRAEFQINEFTKKYQLGVPIAGNFFKAQWVDYDEEFHETPTIKPRYRSAE